MPSDALNVDVAKPNIEQVDQLIALARRRLGLRQWERCNLPIGGSQLGYELFMALGPVWHAGANERSHFLKQLYLTLPYSEKGVRLHLRRLELTGWVTVSKKQGGGRNSKVSLSPRYWALMATYASECDRHNFSYVEEGPESIFPIQQEVVSMTSASSL